MNTYVNEIARVKRENEQVRKEKEQERKGASPSTAR